jgi:hypothetical protein
MLFGFANKIILAGLLTGVSVFLLHWYANPGAVPLLHPKQF